MVKFRSDLNPHTVVMLSTNYRARKIHEAGTFIPRVCLACTSKCHERLDGVEDRCWNRVVSVVTGGCHCASISAESW